MAIDLYYYQASPPSWAVLLIAKALDIHLSLKHTDITQGDNFAPEFIKMNPAHKVPIINDSGFVLTESRAIEGYFVDQYARDDSLYPRDPKKRAKVNQMLYFDIGTLYDRLADYFSVIFGEQRRDMRKLESLQEALSIFNSMMEGQQWVAGDNMTIADYSMTVTVTTAEITGMDISKYPNVKKWYDNSKRSISSYEEYFNTGAKMFKENFDKAVEKLSN